MKVLFILSQPPYPWWFYGRSSMYFTLKSLAKYVDVIVTYPTLMRNEEDILHLLNIGVKAYPFKLDTRDKYYKPLINIFQKKPFKMKKYHSSSYKNFMLNLIEKEKPALIQIHTPHMAFYGVYIKKRYPTLPIVLRLQDIAIDQIKSFLITVKDPFRKFMAKWQLRKTLKYEIDFWHIFDKTIFLTKKDMTNAQTYSREKGYKNLEKLIYITDGVEIKENLYIKQEHKDKSIVFAASDQTQNIETLKSFLKDIWFPICGQIDFNLNIYGKVCNAFWSQINLLKRNKVTLNGFVDDRQRLDYEIAKNKLFLSPTIIGSGYRTKIFEAGAIGMPVISSQFDYECISDFFEKNKDILVYNNKSEFYMILKQIENNEIILQQVSQNFYFKLSKMSWDEVAHLFLEVYNNILFGVEC